MNKHIIAIALIGLTAGLSISAKAAPEKNQEIAMSKCTKDTSKKECSSNSSVTSREFTEEGSRRTYRAQNDKNAPKASVLAETKSTRKSAAQKMISGE